jgi:hypothetical protein
MRRFLALLLLPSLALAGEFVTNPATALPGPKTDARNLPAGSDPNKYLRAPDFNALRDAANDLRDYVRAPNDAQVTATGSTTARTLSAWLADVVNVKGFGTDRAAIMLAEGVAFAAGKTLYFPDGAYTSDGALTFRVPVRSEPGATITTTYTAGPAVTIGDGATYMSGVVVELPILIGTRVWAAGAPGSDVGVRLTAINNGSVIRTRRIAYFTTGILAEGGTSKGFAYNQIHVGHIDNCLVHIDLHPTLTGWVNENQFFGGRLSMDSAEGVGVSGARRIRLRKHVGSAINGPNNNTFVGGSLEGDGAQYHVELTDAANNQFLNMRWETPDFPPKILLDGTGAVNNVFDGGYESNEIEVTVQNGAGRNVLRRGGGSHSIEGTVSGAGASVMELRNSNGVSKGVLQIMPTGVSPLAAGRADGDWVARFTGDTLSLKDAADAEPRIRMSYSSGQLELGPGGAIAPAAAVKATSDSIRFLGAGLARIGFETDNLADIGAPASLRPRAVFIGTYLDIAGGRIRSPKVSADRGDASVTLLVSSSEKVQMFETTLTANRTVTLSTSSAANGDTFRIVRSGLGAFTLDVGPGLKVIPSATAAWVDVAYNGAAWKLTGYGTL